MYMDGRYPKKVMMHSWIRSKEDSETLMVRCIAIARRIEMDSILFRLFIIIIAMAVLPAFMIK